MALETKLCVLFILVVLIYVLGQVLKQHSETPHISEKDYIILSIDESLETTNETFYMNDYVTKPVEDIQYDKDFEAYSQDDDDFQDS